MDNDMINIGRWKTVYVANGFAAGLGFGVFWFVWIKLGFWWGILYGLFWPIWIGYRIAEYIWR